MKLSDILKQFKTIEPDAQFAERTKRGIFAAPQQVPLTVRGIFAVFHMVETGVAVALAGLFILILTGGLGGGNSISPVQYSVIDPSGLRAEAQAIDMQIQLANVDYPQVTSTAPGAASSAEANALSQALSKVFGSAASTSTPAIAASSSAGSVSSSTASSTASTTLSVDQVLQQLSK